MLGLGGGSVARIARALAPGAEIVGIEFEPEVVRLARRHLDLDETGVKVEIADARAWVEAESKKPTRYDAILEEEPQHFRATYNRAFALERLGKDDDARAGYRKALGLRPGMLRLSETE